VAFIGDEVWIAGDYTGRVYHSPTGGMSFYGRATACPGRQYGICNIEFHAVGQ
jgi:hypothetical protein